MVDMLHKEVQRSMENQWQMARLETKRCVGVLVCALFCEGKTACDVEMVGALLLSQLLPTSSPLTHTCMHKRTCKAALHTTNTLITPLHNI